MQCVHDLLIIPAVQTPPLEVRNLGLRNGDGKISRFHRILGVLDNPSWAGGEPVNPPGANPGTHYSLTASCLFF